VSELIIREIYLANREQLSNELTGLRKKHEEERSKAEASRVRNESALKPSLGHPNTVGQLTALNANELTRQRQWLSEVSGYGETFRRQVQRCCETFCVELASRNETLLLKFDDILTVDEVAKNEAVNEKHPTNELLKRKLMGLSLEDPEPAQLIRRGAGVWPGVDTFLSLRGLKKQQQPRMSLNVVTITTLKTTLAHKSCEDTCRLYQTEFKRLAEENLDSIEVSEKELLAAANKWTKFWEESIEKIHKIHA
jgi:hypothetical protein